MEKDYIGRNKDYKDTRRKIMRLGISFLLLNNTNGEFY